MTARALPRFARSAKVAGSTAITGGTPMAPSLRSLIGAALAGVLAANFTIAAQAADKVAVGTGGSASDAPFYIAHDKGFFKDEGLDVDLIVLDSGAKVIAPLGTGELDVGVFAMSQDKLDRLRFHDPAKNAADLASMPEEELHILARNRETLALLTWEPYMHNPKLKHRLHRVNVPTLFCARRER